MAGKRPEETATLVINGEKFEDWTSIEVTTRISEYVQTFQFEASEFSPKGDGQFVPFASAKIIPGDVVDVTLAGIQALHGYVTQRQVAYTSNQHGIRIAGMSETGDLPKSSVFSQSGSYDKMSWTQFARELLKPTGIKLKTVGKIDETKFENIHIQPGELISAALERYARNRCIMVGSTPFGELLAIGEQSATKQGALIEGDNILSANCTLNDEYAYRRIYGLGQRHGNDEVNGDKANKQAEKVDGSVMKRGRVLVIPGEISDIPHGLQQRLKIEKAFTDGGYLEAHITVQGWLQANGTLWRSGEFYHVRSPMLGVDSVLGCRELTYKQAERAGTTTTLVMVDPQHMNAKPNMSATGAPGAGV